MQAHTRASELYQKIIQAVYAPCAEVFGRLPRFTNSTNKRELYRVASGHGNNLFNYDILSVWPECTLRPVFLAPA